MYNILIFLLYLSMATLPVDGYAAVQDSLVPAAQKIKYDTAEDVSIPEFNEQTLQKFKDSQEFDYSQQPDGKNRWRKFKSWSMGLWLKLWDWLVGDYQAGGFIAFLARALPYLIIMAIVVFVGWLFYRLNPGAHFFRSKADPEIFFSEEEEIIRTRNIPELIERALTKREYRMALRYYYLLIL